MTIFPRQDRSCTGKRDHNSMLMLTPCWQLQCSKCKEYFLGLPIRNHQCYRHMFLDKDYCFDPETQQECNRRPSLLPQGRTVFFAVQPRYMNVDIRVVIDVSLGSLDFYLAAKEDVFIVETNKSSGSSSGAHNVWIDMKYQPEDENEDEPGFSFDSALSPQVPYSDKILRKIAVVNDSATPPPNILHVRHRTAGLGLTTYLTIFNPNEVLVVRHLENRLVVTIPQEVHDLRSTRFYMILRGSHAEGTLGNLFFRQDQSRIDLFVFFSVFFSCFFLFLASCVIVWKVKQAFDMRRARRLHAAEMKNMASRPFASVLLQMDPYTNNHSDHFDDFEFALSSPAHHAVSKKKHSKMSKLKGSHTSKQKRTKVEYHRY